jgi:hypothetical protein
MTAPSQTPAGGAPDEPEELGSSYELLFQSWVVLVLLVICFALVSYLLLFFAG